MPGTFEERRATTRRSGDRAMTPHKAMLDWRWLIALAFVLLATSALIAQVYMIRGYGSVLDEVRGNGRQQLCIARVQNGFLVSIADLTKAAGTRDPGQVAQATLAVANARNALDHIDERCPA